MEQPITIKDQASSMQDFNYGGNILVNNNPVTPQTTSTVPTATTSTTSPTTSTTPSDLYTPFNIKIPSTIPSTLIGDSFTDGKTYGDIQKLLNKQSDYRTKMIESLQPTQAETDINKQLAELRARADELTLNAQAGITGVKNKIMPLEFQPGQIQNIKEQANNTLQSYAIQEKNLLTSLGLAQDARKTALDTYTSLNDFATNDVNTQFKIQDAIDAQDKRVLEQANALRDDSRAVLTSILEKFKGLSIEDLDTETQYSLAKLAAQSGVPLDLLVKGMKAVKDQQDFENLMTKQKAQNTSSPDQLQLYQYAKEQGYTGSLLEFINAQKSGSTSGLTAEQRYNIAFKMVESGDAIDLASALQMIDSGNITTPSTPTSNASVDQIVGAIKQIESGGNYAAKGGSGEYGAYQFMPGTWSQYSQEYLKSIGKTPSTGLNQELDKTNPANQDAVARFKVQQWLNQGYNPQQIASMWNSGKPDYQGVQGVNSFGQKYDVPAYVNRFTQALAQQKSTSGELDVNKAKELFSYVLPQMTGTKQKAAQKGFNNLLRSGDTTAASEYIKSMLLDTLDANETSQHNGRQEAISALQQIKAGLQAWKDAGQDTGFFTGTIENISNKVGTTQDPRLAYIANQVLQAFVNYRRSLTGVAFSPAESAQYEKIFPSIGKQEKVNDALLQSVSDTMNRNERLLLSSKLGGDANYRLLYGNYESGLPSNIFGGQVNPQIQALRDKYGY